MKNFTTKVCKSSLLFFCVLMTISASFAQTWTGTTSGTWLTAGNWSPTGAPSGTSAEAFFDININAGNNGINMNSATTNQKSIGAIHWGANASTARTVQNSSTTAFGTLTLNGLTINGVANTILRNASTGNHSINGTANSGMDLALGNITDNIVAIDGTGNITISTAITGANNFTKRGVGTGVLALTGLNTYTGFTTVTEGTLRLNRTGGNTLPATNNVTVNGGTLRISTNQTLNNLTLTTGTVLVDVGVTLTINGTFTVTSGTVTNNGTISYGIGSTLLYNGTTIQTTGGELPTTPATVYNLTINNAANVRMNTNATVANQLTISAGSLNCFGNTLSIAGLSPSIASGSNINATSNATSKVAFINTSPIILPAITFSGSSTSNNFEMNGTGGVTLSGSLNVATALTLTNGNITLGANNLTIGAAGSITGGSSTSYIVTDGLGTLTQSNIGTGGTTTPVVFPVGPSTTLYHPATITNAGAIDSFSVNVNSNPVACADATKTVNATWNITEAATGGSDCTISLDYTGAATGALYSALGGEIVDCGGVAPYYASGTVTGTVATGSGFTSFSPFGITSDFTIVPISLQYFNGKRNGKNIDLSWATATELNAKGFDVQRSFDGVNYSNIAFVAAVGNSTSTKVYNYTDANVITKAFYRLKQVDNNNQSKLSTVVTISGNDARKLDVEKVYVANNNGKTIIALHSPKQQQVKFVVYNMQGAKVFEQNKNIAEGYSNITLELATLQKGIYNIVVISDNERLSKQFLK